MAEDIELDLTLPQGVNCFSGNSHVTDESLDRGTTFPISYDILVPRNYSDSTVGINLIIREKYGDYGSLWEKVFAFEPNTSQSTIISIEASGQENQPLISRASLGNSKANSSVSFNEVPKDVIVETVAVVPVDGKDCNGQTVSGQDIA